MSKLLYFAYGSNLHPNWLRNRVQSAEPISNVSIKNWRLYFNKLSKDGSAKCNIIQTNSSDDIVHGVIYQFESNDKKKLNDAEKGYDPDNMQLGEFDDVLFYIAKKENINDNLLPYSWYKDIVILGAQNHKLPYEYIAYIKSFNATTDPDQERDKKNRLIICPKK